MNAHRFKNGAQQKVIKNFMSPEFAENVSNWVSVLTWMVGGVVAVLAVASWYFSNRVAKDKEAALKVYQQESKVALAAASARAEEARAVAAAANARLAEAGAIAASAQREAATARLETERLKALVSWRELSFDQKERFKAFTASAIKGQVIVSSVQGDLEAASFAQKLAEMLRESGYTVSENLNSLLPLGGLPPRGIQIQIKSEKHQPLHAAPLQKSLEHIGLEAPGALWDVGENQVGIFVGSKP